MLLFFSARLLSSCSLFPARKTCYQVKESAAGNVTGKIRKLKGECICQRFFFMSEESHLSVLFINALYPH